MNILRKITIQNLKLNKKRSIVTTIGILLSVALITAVATMVTSFRESLIEHEKKSSGNYEYVFYDVPESEISFLKNNRSIKDLYLVSGLGYAKIESQNEAKPYAYVVSMNKNAMENLGLNLVEGKVPTNENEIVIPTSVKTNGRLDYKIGDYITLDIGQRQSEGYNLNQNNPYNIDTKEEIINIKVNNISEKRSLYLTVNYQNKRILDNINITVYADDNIILDNDSIKSDYIKLKTFDNSGELKLKIKVEVPVSAGNELSDLSQSIRWDLFIENENGDKFKIPSTIDDSNIYTYVLIFIITFIALIFILILENKDRKGDNL